MDILNCRTLKMRAGEQLPRDHKKLALIHTAIALGAGLLVSLLQLYLNQQIETTGGLSGLGTRSVLETIQMVLQYAVNIALPFWEIGFLFVALRWIRGEKADLHSLPEGFRRFAPVLRLHLIEGLIYMGAGMLCAYIGSMLYTVSPLSVPMQERFLSMAEQGKTFEQMMESMQAMPLEELTAMMWPALLIMGLLFAAVAIFLFYRFRMARFLIMDQPGIGAIMALVLSNRMTKGSRMKLLRLDLSFWWFYVLVLLSTAVTYADMLLPRLGIALPVSGDGAWILSYVLGCLIQLAVYWQCFGYVQTTYAAAYEALRQQPVQPPKPQPVPKNLPWDDYQTPQ